LRDVFSSWREHPQEEQPEDGWLCGFCDFSCKVCEWLAELIFLFGYVFVSFFQYFFDVVVGQCVEDVFSLSSVTYQFGMTQESELVGYGGFGHFQFFGDVANAEFPVA
jgi:hypothetical protein